MFVLEEAPFVSQKDAFSFRDAHSIHSLAAAKDGRFRLQGLDFLPFI